MRHFLLVYDRSTRLLLSETEFLSHLDALEARFQAERERQSADIEIVVVSAKSRASLMKTHGRYFLNLRELADRADRTLS